ncbi:hypothetical protein QUU09_22635, partial [Xanthomonas citri pv. citri]
SRDGQSGLRPAAAGKLRGTKCVWVSIASAKGSFPLLCYALQRDSSDWRQPHPQFTLQAGWTVFNMGAIEE